MKYFDLVEANKVLESIKPLIYDFIEKRDEIVDIIERISTIEDELEKLYMESILEEKKQEVNELIYEISSSGAVVKVNRCFLTFYLKREIRIYGSVG